MLSSEQILETAAQDGSIDITEWPRVLETLLQKLHDIVHNDFPLPAVPLPQPSQPPTIDPEVVASTPPTAQTTNHGTKDDDELPDADAEGEENDPPSNSQSSTKENDAPTDIAARRTSFPSFHVNHGPQSDQTPAEVGYSPGTLPPDLLADYNQSRHILETDFAHSPPYTIQRLAELVLHPKQHYRFLPAYLRALDRIISVSSPVSDFPLPTLHTTMNNTFLTNGDTSMKSASPDRDGLGSDESLGGALLTPIPWLRNNTLATATTTTHQSDGEIHSERTETIEGPHGAGSIETVTVTVNGITSASSAAHTAPASPTLSDQSDASSSSSSNLSGTTEAQLRDQGGVTQGELLRQEQEAGVIPLTQAPPRRALLVGGAAAVGREDPRAIVRSSPMDSVEESTPADELPHARGPEEIGMEDMGPQHHHHHTLEGGLDMEAAVGRGRSKSPQPPEAASPDPAPAPEAEQSSLDARASDAGKAGKDPKDVEKDVEMLRREMDLEKQEEARDADGDVVVADADGRDVEEKEKMEITGDLGGPDATDTTAL